MISSELPEIVGLCARVVVLCEGRKTGELAGLEITENAVPMAVARRDAMSAGGVRERVTRDPPRTLAGQAIRQLPVSLLVVIDSSCSSWLSADREPALCEPEQLP
jgi:hypothetical protein